MDTFKYLPNYSKIIKGEEGKSCIPQIENTYKFSLLKNIDGIEIDPENGQISWSNKLDVGQYIISVQANFINIIKHGAYVLFVSNKFDENLNNSCTDINEYIDNDIIKKDINNDIIKKDNNSMNKFINDYNNKKVKKSIKTKKSNKKIKKNNFHFIFFLLLGFVMIFIKIYSSDKISLLHQLLKSIKNKTFKYIKYD